MQFNHQNSTIPDVYRIDPSNLPDLQEFDSYLLIGQRFNRDFETYFSDDGKDLASTVLISLIKHPRLLAMLKSTFVAAEKLKKNPSSESAMRLAQMVCDYFLENRLTKKI